MTKNYRLNINVLLYFFSQTEEPPNTICLPDINLIFLLPLLLYSNSTNLVNGKIKRYDFNSSPNGCVPPNNFSTDMKNSRQ